MGEVTGPQEICGLWKTCSTDFRGTCSGGEPPTVVCDSWFGKPAVPMTLGPFYNWTNISKDSIRFCKAELLEVNSLCCCHSVLIDMNRSYLQKICIANMSISIITSDCILERKTILPPPCPSFSSLVASTLEKSYAWLKHMLNVGGKKNTFQIFMSLTAKQLYISLFFKGMN